MSTSIHVLSTETSSATGLIAQIQAVNPAIEVANDVWSGALGIGLNRFLDAYAHPVVFDPVSGLPQVPSLIAALVPVINGGAASATATISAADLARIAAVQSLTLALSLSTADVGSAAARTGLALLLGIETDLPPLRTS